MKEDGERISQRLRGEMVGEAVVGCPKFRANAKAKVATRRNQDVSDNSRRFPQMQRQELEFTMPPFIVNAVKLNLCAKNEMSGKTTRPRKQKINEETFFPRNFEERRRRV